jgi:geranylgeranyl diphosphate synthase type II
LGLAFQIRDDLLDMISTTEALGKPVGSDDANGKHTFVTLLGKDACTRRIAEETELAKKALTGAEVNSGFLCWLADELAGRTH